LLTGTIKLRNLRHIDQHLLSLKRPWHIGSRLFFLFIHAIAWMSDYAAFVIDNRSS